MQYFIGVVPPEDYKKRILELQQQWKNNSLVHVVEPHITIKAQGGLTPDKSWISDVKKICEDTAPFSVTLNKPMFFGESVLFLSVESEEIFELHRKLVKTISPNNDLIKKYMELDLYEPHLTLGQTYWGLTSNELKNMAKVTETELSPYPSFEVSFIRIYQEVETNKYIKYIDIPLLNR
ncbi:2'-5' RNA ligase family protein [Neobacillus terrae]|uniref:2'-5' RNA ligase family protein n=1 Tax=Neobacillus terrae TaxID=3034837 RepID=UPI00140B1CA3|nr:2'-5' RNA ligase family protein [Neobacillus terrae]NHM30654.1 2'-5' RNA ligase family protein [Neobacillus terrae]